MIRNLGSLARRMAERNSAIFTGQQPTYQAFGAPPSSPSGGSGVPQFFDQYTGEQRPATAQEVMAAMPAGSTNYVDALRAMASSAQGINGLQDPAVMSWLQQTQGYNPGVAGQVIAAYQGVGDPEAVIQSITSFGRAPTQEELSAGWQSVAQQLASRGDNSLEQAVQAGFFDSFPGFDRAAVDRYIANSQAARDSGGLGGQIARGISNAADVTALSGIEELDPLREVLPLSFNPDVHEGAAYWAIGRGVGQAVGGGLPAYDAAVGAEGATSAAGGSGVGVADPGFTVDPITGDTISGPGFNVDPITGDTTSVFPGGSGGSGISGGSGLVGGGASGGSGGLLPGLGTGAGIGAGITAGSVLGAGIPAVLGAVGADRQADALRDIANQARADRAPFLTRSTDFLNNPNLYFEGPGRSSMDAVLRGLSVHGNPAGMPSSMVLAGELGTRDWLNAVTGLGNLGLSGQDSINRTLTSAAGADVNVLNSIGYGVGQILNPPTSLEQLINQFGKSNQPSLV